MFLSYALGKNQNWVHISTVDHSGRTSDLVCPFCSNPLIAKKGKVVSHHFAHEASQSCRALPHIADYIPPYEGYYVADLSASQQRVLTELLQEHGDSLFYSSKVRSQTARALKAKRFLTTVQVPRLYRDPEQNKNADYRQKDAVSQLTPRAKAFAHQLTLREYAIFAESEHQLAMHRLAEQKGPQAKIALDMLKAEYQRWQKTRLYLIEIESDADLFVKIGITTRPLEQRISEIRTFLKQHYPSIEIRPLFEVPKVPYLEGYFKSKYANHHLQIESTTEYFTPFDQASQELESVAHLVQKGIPVPELPKNRERPRFRATFWRKHNQINDFRRLDDTFVLLIDIVNLATRERVMDWQLLAYGKQFEALGSLKPGDVIEFNAAIADDKLTRPTKICLHPLGFPQTKARMSRVSSSLKGG